MSSVTLSRQLLCMFVPRRHFLLHSCMLYASCSKLPGPANCLAILFAFFLRLLGPQAVASQRDCARQLCRSAKVLGHGEHWCPDEDGVKGSVAHGTCHVSHQSSKITGRESRAFVVAKLKKPSFNSLYAHAALLRRVPCCVVLSC